MERGQRAEEVIGDLYRIHTISVKPAARSVYIPHQQSLFVDDEERGPKNVVGDVGEHTYRGIAGGKLTNGLYIHDPHSKLDYHTKPDLVTSEENVEIKLGHYKNNLILDDLQVARHRLTQREFPHKRGSLAVLRHSVDGVESYGNREQELIKLLAKNLLYITVMDLPVELALHDCRTATIASGEKEERLVYRYVPKPRRGERAEQRGGKYNFPYTGIKPKTLERLLHDPNPVLEAIGLDPQEYIIDRKVTPRTFTVQGERVHVPITYIRHKEYSTWRKSWLAQYDWQADVDLLESHNKQKKAKMVAIPAVADEPAADYKVREGCSQTATSVLVAAPSDADERTVDSIPPNKFSAAGSSVPIDDEVPF